jgi:hypothetical protein
MNLIAKFLASAGHAHHVALQTTIGEIFKKDECEPHGHSAKWRQ